MASLRLNAPAKINLCLRINGRRADGYHDIDSLFVQIDFFDRLEIAARPGRDVALSVVGPWPEVPSDGTNLAALAARAFLDAVPSAPGVTIALEKRIPPGAGLGGGSSDAAQVLMGLNRLAGMPLTGSGVHELAVSLGSDVPFFLAGHAARVGGRGERVTPVPPPAAGAFLLVLPGIHVNTARAYAELGRGPLTNTGGRSMLTCSGDLSRPVGEWARELHNDFEETVFAAHPRIRELQLRLLESGACGAVMSGSGSTVVGVYETVQAARGAAASFRNENTVVATPLGRQETDVGRLENGA